MKSRLGWLGPVIVVVGLAVGSVGVWWMFHARPEPGAVIDVVAIDGEWAVVVRHEAGSGRAFVELVSTQRGIEWQALVPPYAGRGDAPGIAMSAAAISVRVNRNRPELWSLSTRDATKLGAISLDGYLTGTWLPAGPSAVVTVGDGARSFEVIDGTGGAAIVAIDLDHGSVLWHSNVVGEAIRSVTPTAAGLEVVTPAGGIVLDPATGVTRDGLVPGPPREPGALAEGLRFVDGALRRGDARYPWPADARPPLPHHVAGRFLWLIQADQLTVLDTEAMKITGVHKVR